MCCLHSPERVDVWPRPDLGSDEAIRVFARHVQPIVQQAFGREALHGSAVLAPAGAVAFCGLSGAGKSTLAYALSTRGWQQLADDAIVLEWNDNEDPRLRRLDFQPGLRAASLAHFALSADNADRHRRAHSSNDGPRLAAIVLLAQDASLDEPFICQTLTPARAFSTLLPHAHCFDPHDAKEAERLVQRYLALVSRIPVVALAYRPAFEHFDALIARVMTLEAIDREAGDMDQFISEVSA